jgi:hypothetical protein
VVTKNIDGNKPPAQSRQFYTAFPRPFETSSVPENLLSSALRLYTAHWGLRPVENQNIEMVCNYLDWSKV